MSRPLRLMALCGGLALAGCASRDTIDRYSNPVAGFSAVNARSSADLGKRAVWTQTRAEADATNREVRDLLAQKSVTADKAVQIAMLNNKGLQASYADIGLSAADVWQQALPPNPTISIGVLGIGTPELGAFRAIEGMVANNILAFLTQKKRIGIAEKRFKAAQIAAIMATLQVASETRNAWINAVAAKEAVALLEKVQIAADASSDLAKRLGQTGAITKGEQAREHAFYAELSGQLAQARLDSELRKEELSRLMGLWGNGAKFAIPARLPPLPKQPAARRSIEMEALHRRADLQAAKLELEATALAFGLTNATRHVTDLELIAGFEAEREIEDENVKTVVTPQLEIEFVIPIFDSGEARLRKAELAYMRAANLLAAKAVNVRSEAKSAYTAYRANYDIARHYRDKVLPLRKSIEEDSLLTYNGMITNTFELLTDTRAKIGAELSEASARKNFWLAEANLNAATYGGAAGMASGAGETAAATESGSGGH